MATPFTHPAEQIEAIDTSRFECIDGHLLERPLPTVQHSLIQDNLSVLLRPLARVRNMRSGPELSVDRTPGSGSDWMTPDFAVSMPGGYTVNRNGHALPPVYLIVEVLSPGQTMNEMETKAQRYFAWGAKYVWLIDPMKEEALVLHEGSARNLNVTGLLMAGIDFTVALKDVLEES